MFGDEYQRDIKSICVDSLEQDKYQKKVQKYKDKCVERMLFHSHLRIQNNNANGNHMMTNFFEKNRNKCRTGYT